MAGRAPQSFYATEKVGPPPAHMREANLLNFYIFGGWKKIAILESLIFRSRWLLAPFFLGLIIAIPVLLYKFAKQLFSLAINIFGALFSITDRIADRKSDGHEK